MSPQVNQLHDVMQQYLPWHKARVTFTAAFILSLITLTTVNFTKLSNALNGQAKPASNYRRIQRFFAHFDLSGDCLTRLILHLLPVKSDFTISIDRTNWKLGKFNINILTAGIIYEGVAFPICWHLLSKRGNTRERVKLMKRCLHIPRSQIRIVVADREKNGLYKHKTFFCHRMIVSLKRLRKLFANCTSISKPSCANPAAFMSSHLLRYIEMGSSLLPAIAALDAYKKRWGIEANLKSRGFDLEETHLVHEERIEKLKTYRYLTKPIKIKNHGRKAKSLFRYGDHLYVLLNINQKAQEFLKCRPHIKFCRVLCTERIYGTHFAHK